ncbi:hypothetical protein NE237_026371 [Protea cynaroides]|uniref:Pentatricopeptide repeat-containing protein At1g16830 n=1 Tax=Protea cynaroides TaxID=273540 RepID=A0A9Q0H6Z5_9MAGN|nr:hypothetical protein NE237_026371 [Protea cynaroides]
MQSFSALVGRDRRRIPQPLLTKFRLCHPLPSRLSTLDFSGLLTREPFFFILCAFLLRCLILLINFSFSLPSFYLSKVNVLYVSMTPSWKLLQKTWNRILKNPSVKSFHQLRFLSSFSPNNNSIQISKIFSHSELPVRCQSSLTPQIVESTLFNCPSDIIALSFFLWCARQPNYFHNRQSFDQMVVIFSRLTDRLKSVKALVRELECFGCYTKPQTFLILMRIYWRGGIYKLVLEAFEEMVGYGYSPNIFARNMVMDVFFKIGRVDAALGVLRDTRVPNFLTFNIAVCNLCKLNNLSGLWDVLQMMLRQGFYPNIETFVMVLNCYCKSGKLAESLQVLALMITRGIPISVTAWSVLIDGFCRAGRLDEASHLLKKMVGIGLSPTVVTYTSLIKGFMGSQMLDRAYKILNTMESGECFPDLVLCNVLIDSLSKIGRYDDALDIFLALHKMNLEPDSYTFSSVLSILCLSKRFALFPQLVRGFLVSADLVVCNSLLCFLCKAGFPSQAVDFYNDMVDRDFTPDRYSYTALLSGLCRAGRIEESVNVYHGIVMNSSGIDAHIHTVIIGELVKAGQINRAIRLFRKAITEKYPLDVVSYTVAIHGLLQGGRTGEAVTLYRQMKEVGVIPNTYTCNVMFHGLCKVRDLKSIKWLLGDMAEVGIDHDYVGLNMIFRFLVKSNRFDSVLHLLDKMQDLRFMPNEATLEILLDGLARAGEAGDACYPSLKDYLEDFLFVDRTDSDDLHDVAGSVV